MFICGEERLGACVTLEVCNVHFLFCDETFDEYGYPGFFWYEGWGCSPWYLPMLDVDI